MRIRWALTPALAAAILSLGGSLHARAPVPDYEMIVPSGQQEAPVDRVFLADAFLKKCADVYGLKISGLMCIPPAEEAPGPHFALTAKIARRNGLKLLSMGMSADFADAILLGATHVRVGSAIFGGR